MTARLLLATAALFLLAACGPSAVKRADEPAPAPAPAPAPVAKADPCADLTVRLDADTTTVRAADKAPLHALADCARDEERTVAIVCHESGEGTEEYAFATSERLAQSIVTELASRGVTPDQMMARAQGNSTPLCRDKTPACYEQNRRCELSTTK